MSAELEKLKREVAHAYPGMTLQVCDWALLPLRKFEKVDIWAKRAGGPRELDQIFFGLLQNGVVARREIARRLGADADDFVLSHLDILVREGYASFDGDEYSLADRGRRFIRGDFLEERLEKTQISFVWDEMRARICAPGDLPAGNVLHQGREVSHRQAPSAAELTDLLAAHFNAAGREEGLVFYDVDDVSAFARGRLRHAEYAALFYAPASGGGEWRADLRVRDVQIRGGEEAAKFPLCEDLSEKANGDWREEFQKIYEGLQKTTSRRAQY